jgi:hypothetical protein
MIDTLPNGTKFESFEEPELVTETPDELEGRTALCNKLALAGQTKLLAPNRRPITFPFLTREQAILFSFFCPQATPLADYDLSPIPLRVLEYADRAISQGINHLTVWHPAVVRTDPILLGNTGTSFHSASTRVLIARWGAELDEWPALVAKFKTAATELLASTIAKAEADLAGLRAGGLAHVMANSSSWDHRFAPSFRLCS